MSCTGLIVMKEECSICFENINYPEDKKYLTCCHYFCKSCVTDLYKFSKENYIHCPMCRKIHKKDNYPLIKPIHNNSLIMNNTSQDRYYIQSSTYSPPIFSQLTVSREVTINNFDIESYSHYSNVVFPCQRRYNSLQSDRDFFLNEKNSILDGIFQTTSQLKEQTLEERQNLIVKIVGSTKVGSLRTNVFGKKVNYCARTVIGSSFNNDILTRDNLSLKPLTPTSKLFASFIDEKMKSFEIKDKYELSNSWIKYFKEHNSKTVLLLSEGNCASEYLK